MGRLFKKFFLVFFLAQCSTVLGVSLFIHLRHSGHISIPRSYQKPHRSEPPFFSPQDKRSSIPLHGQPFPPGPHMLPPPGPSIPFLPIGVGVIASLVFAALLARHFAKPITHLRYAFDALAKGDLNVRLKEKMGNRRDELADLGRDFDRTAQQLQSLIESRENLLHDVSHELRSPLARIQLALDLAHQQPEKYAAFLARIELETAKMNELIGELLNLARIENHMSDSSTEFADINSLLTEAVENARFEAERKHLTFDYVPLLEQANVNGRAELLQRAIENVVRNAIKYSPTAGNVSVCVRRNVQTWELEVNDNGPGVPDERLNDIFLPFTRLEHTARKEGHGLGLAIAKRIVIAHRGSIEAHNRAEGGLTVSIKLPIVA